ncbi:hypothetical protein Q31a_17680 [Aureliella helgolandensis]|uniref:Uncharacterized protein n=1 Tax=Aureliella helgolandensis TaxID=2527968 RepID=A0A518G4K2_9BACT|nr:hypothetical protein Q31a_17680 [Aureliella helgolandensis]
MDPVKVADFSYSELSSILRSSHHAAKNARRNWTRILPRNTRSLRVSTTLRTSLDAISLKPSTAVHRGTSCGAQRSCRAQGRCPTSARLAGCRVNRILQPPPSVQLELDWRGDLLDRFTHEFARWLQTGKELVLVGCLPNEHVEAVDHKTSRRARIFD